MWFDIKQIKHLKTEMVDSEYQSSDFGIEGDIEDEGSNCDSSDMEGGVPAIFAGETALTHHLFSLTVLSIDEMMELSIGACGTTRQGSTFIFEK